ncbi:MAG: hypothetical protein LBR53_11410 [Deltaproteobacteria bacterium]|nr:hypothetical protein [Deltaproteobacteria bacterium]
MSKSSKGFGWKREKIKKNFGEARVFVSPPPKVFFPRRSGAPALRFPLSAPRRPGEVERRSRRGKLNVEADPESKYGKPNSDADPEGRTGRTLVEQLSNIGRTIIERLSNVYRTLVEGA